MHERTMQRNISVERVPRGGGNAIGPEKAAIAVSRRLKSRPSADCIQTKALGVSRERAFLRCLQRKLVQLEPRAPVNALLVAQVFALVVGAS